ncbi:hypothetical protein FH972_011864 [Carpinus fangiana]|uniref:Uncharacterized protein n=1 Tax=Carpinus fangiana TaxID=176857 RepID=A0A5N6R5G5_9ROSI|nr:hypothetical protein FH972_011864 [Carpinus fangiana]
MEAEDKIKFEEMGMRKIGKFTIAEKKEQQEQRRRLRTLLRKICSKTKMFCLEDVEGRVLTPQKVKPSSVLIPIDWAVKFDENRPKVLTPQASNNSDHIKSLDDGVVRLTLRSRRPDEDQGRMVYPLQSISMITRVQPVDEKKQLQRKRFPKT